MDTQEAKKEILARIKSGKPELMTLPEVPRFGWPGDPVENFIKMLHGFDGRAVKFGTREEALRWLKEQPEMDMAANVIYSSAEGVKGNMGEEELKDLHEACAIQTCVTEAEMGVGETGSVWVTDESLGHAACALLSRHLFVLLDCKKIVGGMHDAYACIDLRKNRFGSFFSGPSATADIEAVHITGAQGPLSLTVILYNCG